MPDAQVARLLERLMALGWVEHAGEPPSGYRLAVCPWSIRIEQIRALFARVSSGRTARPSRRCGELQTIGAIASDELSRSLSDAPELWLG
jgi:hypothetical protein